MKVYQHYTASELRNFTYFVEGDQGHFFIIDPWDGEQCLDFVHSKRGLIKGVINTHEHWDHTRGNSLIVEKSQCAVYAHPGSKGIIPEANVFLKEGDKIQIDKGSQFEVLYTPGHTSAHVCLLLWEDERPKAIFSGDTLFNAGVGNCHNGGNPEVLFETIEKKVRTLDPEIIVYPGHEYLGNNLGFTLKYEPENNIALEWLKRYEKINWREAPVVTKIKDELEINTFFRLEEKGLVRNLPGNPQSKKEVFLKLRELRNQW